MLQQLGWGIGIITTRYCTYCILHGWLLPIHISIAARSDTCARDHESRRQSPLWFAATENQCAGCAPALPLPFRHRLLALIFIYAYPVPLPYLYYIFMYKPPYLDHKNKCVYNPFAIHIIWFPALPGEN